jgi:hypothetical protein
MHGWSLDLFVAPQEGEPSLRGAPMFELPEARDVRLDGQAHRFLGAWFALAYWAGCGLYFSGLSLRLPGFLSLTIGGFLFCLGPGLALYSLLAVRRASRFSLLSLLVLSCSLGFTCNFLANVVIYAITPGLDQAMAWYLAVVATVYVCLARRWRRNGAAIRRPPPGFAPGHFMMMAGLLAALGVILYYKMPPGFYVEELMVLRKIADNSAISATNIAFKPGEHTTYYFVPFYLFIAMASRFAGLDVIAAVPGLWPFTAAISLLCLVAIARVCIRHRATQAAIVAMTAIHAAFFASPPSNLLTVFAPHPDRYALAAGVLIPLALFHFFIHMAEPHINLPAFVGLVYLITEITFIHARETLFFIAILLMAGALMLRDWRENRNDLLRLAGLLVVVGLILLVYRQANLAFQPELSGLVARLKVDMLHALREGWERHGIASVFGIPQFHGLGRTDAFPYAEHFGLWRQFGGLGFVPFTICLLPIYALAADRRSALLAPAAIAAFGLFSLFQGARLAIGYLVGAPFIFDIFSVLFILCVLVFADMARMIAALFLAPGSHASRVERLRGALLFLLGVTAAAVLTVSERFGFATGSPYLEMLLYLWTLAHVFLRAASLQRGPGRSGSALGRTGTGAARPQALHARIGWWPGALVARYSAMAEPRRLVWGAVAIALLGNVGWLALKSPVEGKANVLVSWLHPYHRTGVLEDDYGVMSRERLFALSRDYGYDLPPELIRFIRASVPEGQVWFGAHTLPVLIVSNQYAPLISFSGALNGGFEANLTFLNTYRHGGAGNEGKPITHDTFEKEFICRWFESEESTARLRAVFREFKVGWVITVPAEQRCLDELLRSRRWLAGKLVKEFESEGYGVFRVVAPPL